MRFILLDQNKLKSLQSYQEKASQIQKELLFFDLEWAALEDDVARKFLDDPSLQKYRLKKELPGVDELFDYDRYAPLPFSSEKPILWEEGKDMVLRAYNDFSPDMKETGCASLCNGQLYRE